MRNLTRFDKFIGAGPILTIPPPFMATTITAHTSIRIIQGRTIAGTVRGRPTILTIDIRDRRASPS